MTSLVASEVEAALRERLATLAPLRLELVDDSARHSGHHGARSGGRHYRLRIVSARFSGMPMLARHRLVHAALGDLMHGAIHALSIEAQAPDELQ